MLYRLRRVFTWRGAHVGAARVAHVRTAQGPGSLRIVILGFPGLADLDRVPDDGVAREVLVFDRAVAGRRRFNRRSHRHIAAGRPRELRCR